MYSRNIKPEYKVFTLKLEDIKALTTMFFILLSKQPSQVGSLFTFLARQMAKQEKRIHVNKVLFEQVGGLESSMSRVWWEREPGSEVKKGTHSTSAHLRFSGAPFLAPLPHSSPLLSPSPFLPSFPVAKQGWCETWRTNVYRCVSSQLMLLTNLKDMYDSISD